ncbi:putative reverse transcriptase domain-containing protein [Tanacetum coccineum]
MTTASQGMSVEEIKQIIAKRVANAIEAVAIYESINQAKQRENKISGNASNKRKWEGAPMEALANNKTKGIKIPVPRAKQRSVVSGKKAEVICYGCGGLGHYKSNCPIVKFHNRVNMYWKGKAHGDSSAETSNINI